MNLSPETMEAPTKAPAPEQNLLLAALLAEVKDRLYPQLERVALTPGQVLSESGEVIRHIYFPTNCVVSLLCTLENGAAAETSVVGNEGFVGVALCLGNESAARRASVLSAGFAYRLTKHRALDEFDRHGELLALAMRDTQCLITQMAQSVACNRYHSIEQQLCRLLLLSMDRLQSNRLTMTHELMATMLGVRREGISEAAGKLHRLGVLNYSRGHIRVLDRRRLLALSCECYAVVKKETDRLLPFRSQTQKEPLGV